MDITSKDVATDEQHREHFQVKAILLQHIEGFSLSYLGFNAHLDGWQGVVNQAVRVAHALGDHNVLNGDVGLGNFFVSRCQDGGDSNSGDFRVFMVDFGQSQLRRDEKSDFDWGRAKWKEDEEGAVGLVKQHRLQKLGREIAYAPSLRYLEFAEGG